MLKKQDIQKLMHIVVIAAMALLCACSADVVIDSPESPESPAKAPQDTWLLIKISVPRDNTRAVSTESALDHESFIQNLNIFIFEDKDGKGVNREISDIDPGTLYSPIYVEFQKKPEDFSDCGNDIHVADKGVGTYECRLKINNNEILNTAVTEGYRIIVIANAGNLTHTVTSLKQLRDMQMGQYLNGTFSNVSWNDHGAPANVMGYTHFTMANAHESEGKIMDAEDKEGDYKGSETNPFKAEVCLERTAARIDFMYNDGNYHPESAAGAKDAYFMYDVTDGKKTCGRVEITHIIPVNVMQRSSYIFKHIMTPTDNGSLSSSCSVKLCDKEERNYVLEPTTLSKTEGSAVLSTLYGPTRRENVAAAMEKDLKAEAVALLNPVVDGFDFSKYSVAAIRGVKNEDGSYSNVKAAAPEDGWKNYSIISYANENTHHKDVKHEDYATGLVLRAIYVPDIVYGKKDGTVFETKEEKNEEGTIITEEKLHQVNVGDNADWRGKTFWRCSSSNTSDTGEKNYLYFDSIEAAKEYAKHMDSTDTPLITEYKNGICYYNLWLRHDENASPTDGITGKMEYVTVRNNIYRVAVSFTGAGNAIPVIREPYNIHPRIFVRKWNLRRFSEIIV